MPFDINNLYQRYSSLKTEITISERKRKDEAEKIVSALSQVSTSEIEMLSNDLPYLSEICKYTVDALLENKNNEIEKVKKTYNDLTFLLDKYLQHFEESLC